MPFHPDRIDGAAEWAKLPPDVQARIGAGAIELIAPLRRLRPPAPAETDQPRCG